MDDLISRQQAMALRFTKAINEDGIVYVPLGEYLKGIKSLPSAQQWIPCSERLPEGNTIVLATTADYMYIVEFEVYSNGHMYWNEVNEYRSIEGVIAWMPLPPSFKEE